MFMLKKKHNILQFPFFKSRNNYYLFSFASNYLIYYPIPISLTYLGSFGFLAGLCLITQIISGIASTIYYFTKIDLIFTIYFSQLDKNKLNNSTDSKSSSIIGSIFSFIFSKNHYNIGFLYIISALLIGIIVVKVFFLLFNNLHHFIKIPYHIICEFTFFTVLYVIIPLFIGGFGNLLIPTHLNISQMSFPKLNFISFILSQFSALLMLVSILHEINVVLNLEETFFYYIISYFFTNNLNIFYTSLFIFCVSFILQTINFLSTILNRKFENILNLSFFIFSILLVCILSFLVVPILINQHFNGGLENFYMNCLPQSLMKELAKSFWFIFFPVCWFVIFPAKGILFDIFFKNFNLKFSIKKKLMYLIIIEFFFVSFPWTFFLYYFKIENSILEYYVIFLVLILFIQINSCLIYLFFFRVVLKNNIIKLEIEFFFFISFLFLFLVGELFLVIFFFKINSFDLSLFFLFLIFLFGVLSIFSFFCAIYYNFKIILNFDYDKRLSQLHFFSIFLSVLIVFSVACFVISLKIIFNKTITLILFQYCKKILLLSFYIFIFSWILFFFMLIKSYHNKHDLKKLTTIFLADQLFLIIHTIDTEKSLPFKFLLFIILCSNFFIKIFITRHIVYKALIIFFFTILFYMMCFLLLKFIRNRKHLYNKLLDFLRFSSYWKKF